MTINLNSNKITAPDLVKASEITINLQLFKASEITINIGLLKVSIITINLNLFKARKITLIPTCSKLAKKLCSKLANKPIYKSSHLKSIYLRSNHLTCNYKKNFFVSHSKRMLNPSLNELKQIAKMRRIKGYKNMSKERLLSVLNESESAKSKQNFNNANIQKRLGKILLN